MQSDKYWALRALQREQEAFDSTTDMLNLLRAIYTGAAARLSRMVQYIFGNFAKSSGGMIDNAKVKALLSESETTEVMAKLRKEYAETGSASALLKLNAPAYAYRINRVQAMRRAIDAEVQALGEMQLQIGAPHIAKTYDEAYHKTMYDAATSERGIPLTSVPAGEPGTTAQIQQPVFDRLSERTIQQALENKWHGKNYSDRVWDNTHLVAKEGGRVIDEGVASGTSTANMTVEIKKLFGVAYYAADRLVRTETSRMHNDATLRGYAAMGVKWYTWLGTLDARTCKHCGALDGQHFKVAEAVTGRTLPPLHPNCRCTTVPYFPDDDREGKRLARDPVTGRNYHIDRHTTYEQWRKQVGTENLDKALKYYRKNKKWSHDLHKSTP